MVPSGKGIDGAFQRASPEVVSPVLVLNSGAAEAEAEEVVESRLAGITEFVVESASSGAGMAAFFAIAVFSDTTVVDSS
jgi:hypothetical protein